MDQMMQSMSSSMQLRGRLLPIDEIETEKIGMAEDTKMEEGKLSYMLWGAHPWEEGCLYQAEGAAG